MCSPRAWGWPELGRGTRRRGRTAKTGGGGRGGSAPATTRARPRQQVAREGLIGSKKGAWAVARPWEAGGRTSTVAARMAQWSGNAGVRRGERAAFIGAARPG
jgi:hypothetical protein